MYVFVILHHLHTYHDSVGNYIPLVAVREALVAFSRRDSREIALEQSLRVWLVAEARSLESVEVKKKAHLVYTEGNAFGLYVGYLITVLSL